MRCTFWRVETFSYASSPSVEISSCAGTSFWLSRFGHAVLVLHTSLLIRMARVPFIYMQHTYPTRMYSPNARIPSHLFYPLYIVPIYTYLMQDRAFNSRRDTPWGGVRAEYERSIPNDISQGSSILKKISSPANHITMYTSAEGGAAGRMFGRRVGGASRALLLDLHMRCGRCGSVVGVGVGTVGTAGTVDSSHTHIHTHIRGRNMR